jgi:hypothetical protein
MVECDQLQMSRSVLRHKLSICPFAADTALLAASLLLVASMGFFLASVLNLTFDGVHCLANLGDGGEQCVLNLTTFDLVDGVEMQARDLRYALNLCVRF